MPIKCPVAPLEFTFLADSFFKDRQGDAAPGGDHLRDSALDAAFTKPIAAQSRLGSMLNERDILLEPDFYIESVDNEEKGNRLL